MSEVARMHASISVDLAKFNADMVEAAQSWEGLGRRMNAIGQKMTLFVTAPLLAIGGAATKIAADFQALEIGLTAVTGSAAEAAKQIDRLRDVAKLPAVDLEQAAQASLAFQAIGKDAQFAERMIKGVANAVALSGGGADQFGGVMRQMRQVAGLGRLMGEEMNIIVENAPVMAKAIQQAFGTTSTEAIQKMGLSTDEFFERMMQAMEALPRVAGGAKNTFENFGQAIRQAAETIGDQLLPVIVPATEAVSKWAEKLREINPELIGWGIAIAAAAAAIGPLLIVVGSLTTALGLLASAIGIGLLPLIGVGGAIVLGLGALVAMFVKNKLEAAAFREELERLNDVSTFSGEQLQAEEQRLKTRQAELVRLQKQKEGILRTLDPETAIYRNIERDLQGVNAEYGTNLKRLGEIKAAMGDIATLPPITASVGGAPDAKEFDKYVDTLTRAVQLGLASAEQQEELRRLQFQLRTAALDANVPLQRRLELIEQSRDAANALVAAQRKHVLMTDGQASRLRLPGAGTVVAANIPTAEIERAALGVRHMSDEVKASIQSMADGIASSFTDIVTGTRRVLDGFRDMVTGIIREVARLTIEKPIANFLAGLFGSFAGSIGAGAAPSGVTPNPVTAPAFSRVGGTGSTIIHESNYITISAVDARSFDRLVKDNPSAILETVHRANKRSSAFLRGGG